MSKYDWEKIVKDYNDKELKRIFREKYKEPIEKVNAVIEELKNRGLLNSDTNELIITENENTVYEISDIHRKTKPNMQNANRAIIGIGIVLVLYIVSIVSSVLQYDLLTKVKEGIFFTWEAGASNDNREMIIGIVIIIAYAVSSILFLVWFYNAYKNLSQRIRKTEFSVGWTIGAWYVPILSWFRPFNIMEELNDQTNRILKHRGEILESKGKSLIVLWWILFIINLYISRTFLKLTLKSETIDDLIWATIGDIFISSLGIVLAIVTIMMIKRFAQKEEVLFQAEINNAPN